MCINLFFLNTSLKDNWLFKGGEARLTQGWGGGLGGVVRGGRGSRGCHLAAGCPLASFTPAPLAKKKKKKIGCLNKNNFKSIMHAFYFIMHRNKIYDNRSTKDRRREWKYPVVRHFSA